MRPYPDNSALRPYSDQISECNCFETKLTNSHVKKTFKDDLREQDWFESTKVEQFGRRTTTMQLQILQGRYKHTLLAT